MISATSETTRKRGAAVAEVFCALCSAPLAAAGLGCDAGCAQRQVNVLTRMLEEKTYELVSLRARVAELDRQRRVPLRGEPSPEGEELGPGLRTVRMLAGCALDDALDDAVQHGRRLFAARVMGLLAPELDETDLNSAKSISEVVFTKNALRSLAEELGIKDSVPEKMWGPDMVKLIRKAVEER